MGYREIRSRRDCKTMDIHAISLKNSLNWIEDILNPIPITIEFIMPPAHFKKYGALLHYQITKDSTQYNLDYDIHQFTNADNTMVKTQISNLKITWDQLTNAKLEDFINKPLGVLISYHDPVIAAYLKPEHVDKVLVILM